MPEIPFLFDLTVLLAAAVVVVLVCHRLRIPTVVGFLLTGVLIGPSGLALVAREEEVEIFAEIGVVVLLFTIGLELSLDRLKQLRRAFFLGGGLQVALTIAAGLGLGLALGYRLPRATLLGFLLALSSTAVVLKLYADRRETETPHGRLAVGILLFQDFAIVPMIVLTPVLAGAVEASPSEILGRFGLGLLVIGAVFAAARFLMPRLLHLIVLTRIREVLVLGAVVAGLGLALLTEHYGFSLALGAFIAGILISESEYSSQVFTEILPFRDVFNSLFFISIGMLLDLGYAITHLPQVAGTVAVIVLVKAGIVFALALLLAYPVRTALTAAGSLAQVGEFSFVLITVALSYGLVDESLFQLFVAASVATMILTPFLISAAPALARRLPDRGGRRPEEDPVEPRRNHVVVVGFGVGGQSLARVLSQAHIPYVVVELSGEAVKRARAAGEPILFGDASRREILEHAGVEEAAVAVFAISDPLALQRSVALARQLAPRLHVLVRTRRVDEIDELLRLGASEVVAEELETSIELFTRVLLRYRVPANVIEAETKILRGEGYQALRSRAPLELSDAIERALAGGITAVFQIEPSHRAAGATIHELDLRRATGASVIAVVRGEEPVTNPPASFRLEDGDAVVLVGGHGEIRRAFGVLEGEAPDG